MAINGVVGEVNLAAKHAADGRHGPVLKTREFPAGIGAMAAGELLFEGQKTDSESVTTYGPVPAADADKIQAAAVQAEAGTETDFDIDLGQEVVPGTVSVETDDSTAKKLTDQGDGTLAGDDGEGTVDYASGRVHIEWTAAPAATKKTTVKAVPGSAFAGVLDDDVEAGEAAASLVVHGTICEGIAKIGGEAASKEQVRFLSRHGIY